MQLSTYHNNPDGDICFPVKRQHYLLVLAHLRSKGLHPGGKHTGTGFDEIRIGDITLTQLREALADFDEGSAD